MGKLSDFNQGQTENREHKTSPTEEDIMEKYNQYKDLSSDQLSQELFREASRQKQNGTFNFSQLSSMVDSLKGSLPDEQYQNMKRLLDSLK